MPITITLPDDLATRLQRGAQARNQSVEDLAITMLDESLNQNDNQRALENLVARIKATPPNPNAIRPARRVRSRNTYRKALLLNQRTRSLTKKSGKETGMLLSER